MDRAKRNNSRFKLTDCSFRGKSKGESEDGRKKDEGKKGVGEESRNERVGSKFFAKSKVQRLRLNRT